MRRGLRGPNGLTRVLLDSTDLHFDRGHSRPGRETATAICLLLYGHGIEDIPECRIERLRPVLASRQLVGRISAALPLRSRRTRFTIAIALSISSRDPPRGRPVWSRVRLNIHLQGRSVSSESGPAGDGLNLPGTTPTGRPNVTVFASLRPTGPRRGMPALEHRDGNVSARCRNRNAGIRYIMCRSLRFRPNWRRWDL